MEFVHKSYQKGVTIAAVATPPGEGGIAVIRISGDEALDVADRVYSGPVKKYLSHTVHFGKILSAEGAVIDEVLIVPMRAPRSFTGEDTVEIHCHGGSLITRRVLERVFEAGARPAEPGEFSQKAFRNGKIDLAQAEAIQEVIAAKNELALAAAEKQLQGRLSQKIVGLQRRLADVAAIIEAWVDFPEEGLEFASEEEILGTLGEIGSELKGLIASFREGKIVKEGLRLCLLGAPNVGKSSLMNALLGKERSIVTEIAGTTRDLIDEDLKLGELHFQITDTAGIRVCDEVIEKEGIRRSRQAAEEADLILLVLDLSRPRTLEEEELIAFCEGRRSVIVWNKCDLPHEQKEGLKISASEGQGIDSLKVAIHEAIWERGVPSKEEITITQERHFEALKKARGFLDAVTEGLQAGTSPEFLAFDLRSALKELAAIVGTNVTEDILDSIFSKFCVGK